MGCVCSKPPPHSPPPKERSQSAASAMSQRARRKADEKSQDRFSADVVGSSQPVALPQGGASKHQQLDNSSSSQRSDNPLVPPLLSPPWDDNDTQQPLSSPLGGSQQSAPSFSQQKEPFWVPLGEKKRSSTVTPQLPPPPLKHGLFRHQGAKTQHFYHRHARSDSICSCGSRSSGPITAPPPTYQKRLLPVPVAATTQRPYRTSPSSVENSASLSGLVASAHPFSSQPITVVDEAEATENTTNSDSHNSGLVNPARNLPQHPLPWLIHFESLTYSQSTLGAPFQSASLSDRDRMLSLSVGPAQATNNAAAGNQDPTLNAKALCAFSSNSCSRVTTALPSLTVTSEERSFLSMTITSAGGVADEGSNTSSMNINSTSSPTLRRSSSSSPREPNSSSVVTTEDSNSSPSIFSAAAAPSSSAVTTLSALISSADEKGIAMQQHSW